MNTPTTSTYKGMQRETPDLRAHDAPVARDPAMDAFEEVLAYIHNALTATEEENVKLAHRANAVPVVSSTGTFPTGTPSPAPPRASTFLSAPQLLRTYCSVGGMANDGTAMVIVYGDLLFCYLTEFYANEKENVEIWQRQCPRFVAYRNRVAARSKGGGGGGGEVYKDGDAVAMLYFLIHLCVKRSTRSSRFHVLFMHDSTRTHFSLGVGWLQEVIALLPLPYQQACCQIILVKPKRNYLQGISTLYKNTIGAGGSSSALNSIVSSTATLSGVSAVRAASPAVLRVSHIQELPKALPFIATYLPLPIFEYQVLMKERKKERTTVPASPLTSVGGIHTPVYDAVVVSLRSPISHAPAPSLSRRKVGHVSIPVDQIDREQIRLDSLPIARRYLHERWARPLTCWLMLRNSGIWMLQISKSFVEVLCTATCRRSYADGLLYPLLGAPTPAFRGLAGFIVDSFATFTSKSLKYIGQEPKWLRESAMVTNGPVTASTSDLQVQIPADVKLCSPDEERFHSTWLFFGQSKAKEKDYQLFEATFQRLIFISTEVDAIEEGRGWDQIVSTRWGLDIYHKRDGDAPEVAKATTTEARRAISSRFVPCLRQLPLRCLWRLILYNIQQMCTVLRTRTPNACPFTTIAAAVEKVRVNLAAAQPVIAPGCLGTGVVPPRRFASMEPGVTPTQQSSRPALPVTHSTCDDVVVSVAAQALLSCYDAEISVIRLLVSIAAYLRNLHAVHLSDVSYSRAGDCISRAELNEIVKRGMSELVYSRPAASLGEQRVVELLACHGKTLMQNARLPYDESCSWHPYTCLWYSS